MKNIRWNIVMYAILGLSVVVGLAVLMSLINRKDEAQACSSLFVNVEGKETFIDQHDISTMINNQFGNIVGSPLGKIKFQEIEDAIEKLPYVSLAEVSSDMDGKVEINVHQREVLLRVINKNGREFYVDGEGNKIPVTLKYVPHVLVATGNIKEGSGKSLEAIQSNTVKDLVKIVNHVRGDDLWENQIVQIYVNEQNDIELIPRVGKEVLVIGSADSLDYKLDRLKTYYTNILPRVGTDAYAKVNVKYAGQIICERRGDWYLDSLQMKINMKN